MIPAMRLGNSILHKQKLSAVNRELLILRPRSSKAAPMNGASMFRSRGSRSRLTKQVGKIDLSRA